MGVYIKGMKMPHDCFVCEVECSAEGCPCYLGINNASEYMDSRHPDCPLVEVKEPHGRLVDESEMLKFLIEEEGSQDAFEAVVNSPTVIEGSK